MQLALGSTNPAKRRAVLLATGHEPVCVSVPSGVTGQPLSADETLHGAIQRARGALAAVPGADIGLGLEGGVDFDARHTRQWVLLSVCAAWDGRGLYVARGVSMPLPQAIGARLQAGGIELAAIMDELGGTTASNHKDGAYGLLSGGRITRAEGFRDAVIAALTPFQNAMYRAQAGG